MNKQREMALKVPQLHNDGSEVAPEIRKKIENFMLIWFGGFSRHDACGAWRSESGQRFDDVCWHYEIASSQFIGDKVADDLLLSIAQIVKLDCAQESVYVRLWNGSVQFV